MFVCFKGRIDLCLTNRVRMCRNPRGTNETRTSMIHNFQLIPLIWHSYIKRKYGIRMDGDKICVDSCVRNTLNFSYNWMPVLYKILCPSTNSDGRSSNNNKLPLPLPSGSF